MKYELDLTVKATLIPDVGDVWSYDDSETAFFRVEDRGGARALQNSPEAPYFYSVDLGTGQLVYTPRGGARNIVILKPEKPIKFVPARAAE